METLSLENFRFVSMDLSGKYIKQFLDALDLVLNSNTFLLDLEADFEDAELASLQVSEFMASGQFKAKILEQDLSREWGNYHYSAAPVFPGNLMKPDFKITLTESSPENAMHYLQNMLTTEVYGSIFGSPYSHEMARDKAIPLVQNFLHELMLQRNWRMYTMNTDFSYTRRELGNKSEMAYFEGGMASDSATLLVREDNHAFILLTNGID